MRAQQQTRQWAKWRKPQSRKRRGDLARKIEAAGFAIAAGIDLLDLVTLDQIAVAAFYLISTPDGQRAARRTGFDLINSAPARTTTDYETRDLAAGGYHILRAGIFPGTTEPAIAIGALALAART